MRSLKQEALTCPFALRLSLVVAILTFLPACAANQSKPHDWQGYSAAEAVQKRIDHDPRLEDLRIVVSFSEGTATIAGEVDSLGQKNVAEEGLYEVARVHTVVNNLTVKPPTIKDHDLAHRILIRIPAHCLVNVKDIRVKVRSGHVEITGRSKGTHHKDVISNIARFSHGVRSVDNRIRVLPHPVEGNPTDLQIKKNVQGVVWSLSLETEDIRIEVENGVVELTGTVPSYDRIKPIATALREVPGVVQVKNEVKEPNRLYHLFLP